MTGARIMALVGGLIGLLVLSSSLFTVKEWELAIKFRLGEIVRDDYQPGLHWMIPVLNNVRKFDARILTLDAEPARFLTKEKKDVIVDSFVKWRISDVARFYRAMGGNELNASRLLSETINDGLRGEFGKRTIQEVVSGERREIMDVLTKEADQKADEFGIEIVDVRVKKIDLPPEVSNSVHRRMRAERERVARELRSQGSEQAERTMADADRQRTVILAEAYRESEQVRGEGDAGAAETYAKAYDHNREFYSFYRSLSAYQKVFESGSDMIVLKPDSEFFQYFKQRRSDGAR